MLALLWFSTVFIDACGRYELKTFRVPIIKFFFFFFSRGRRRISVLLRDVSLVFITRALLQDEAVNSMLNPTSISSL